MKTLEHCLPCNLDFSPRMLRFHLEGKHLILRCQVCRRLIWRLGLARTKLLRAQFCSPECLAEAERRKLCLGCSRAPDATFRHDACKRCRGRGYGVIREIVTVNEELRAIRRARVLPLPYQRRLPAIA
jgi:hypothetical protein